MKSILMNEQWNASNAIRSKVYNEFQISDTNKSFKQYCNTKEAKQLIIDYTNKYIKKAKDNIEVSFINAYVKGEKLYVLIESDDKNIINQLSYKCNTSLWFIDCSYELEATTV